MSQPNFVFFMPDQLRADAVGCFGNTFARTPHIDALAARGVRFDDAWAQHPVCGPSRVSLLTGWYPHVAGHRTLTNLIEDHEPNLFKTLRTAGYQVMIAGDRGDHGMAQSQFFDGPGDVLRFGRVGKPCRSVGNVAETAVAAAAVAEDHEGGGPPAPALPLVGAGGAAAAARFRSSYLSND